MLRLPRKSSRGPAASKRAPAVPKESKCRTYAPNGASATQKQPGTSGVQACAGSPQRVKVLHLPRRSTSMCTKCCACHAKAAGDQRRPSARRRSPESQSVAPATQKYVQAIPKESKCCTCHAKVSPCSPNGGPVFPHIIVYEMSREEV